MWFKVYIVLFVISFVFVLHEANYRHDAYVPRESFSFPFITLGHCCFFWLLVGKSFFSSLILLLSWNLDSYNKCAYSLLSYPPFRFHLYWSNIYWSYLLRWVWFKEKKKKISRKNQRHKEPCNHLVLLVLPPIIACVHSFGARTYEAKKKLKWNK